VRIVTWNCCGNLARKSNQLLELNPDIAIIPESLLEHANCLAQYGYKGLWTGDPGQKGLAFIYKSPWTLRQQGTTEHKWIVPISVSGPEAFTLIGVWPLQLNGGKSGDYVKVIRNALTEHPEWLTNGPVVLAGDFNSHWKWDKAPTNEFASLVANLSSHGLLSAYHLYHKEIGGQETRPTFHHNWKPDQPFHIDYIFIPAAWESRLKSFELGEPNNWLEFSDHCPLAVDISAL
jgi:exodeoxyribonuclease-3